MSESWQEAVTREVRQECAQTDPLASLKIKGFVSRSKGKGRKRKHWCEITLVNFPSEDGDRFHELKRAPVDTYTVGIYGRNCDQIERRNYLRDEIERRAHAKC